VSQAAVVLELLLELLELVELLLELLELLLELLELLELLLELLELLLELLLLLELPPPPPPHAATLSARSKVVTSGTMRASPVGSRGNGLEWDCVISFSRVIRGAWTSPQHTICWGQGSFRYWPR
jgi:hypothetical protein